MDLSLVSEIPTAMRERIVEMGGYEINLVIQKQLQDTDLNKNEGRLSLPAKKLLYDFTTEEERRLLS
ncbi:putative B3 domain-containing protein [Cucumis melo var. makuwa]|uniref:B3 domain-containing protein n=2 Tax=Cucumis melo TaxID=3656 RepID=A0A5D3E4N7_CUCMM|nr:putative B3 domain-containing protein [Cucumis melo var. makuwa]TYK30521.1 putative B3 domain-containing protein [Cucumis melo var. makuwa]